MSAQSHPIFAPLPSSHVFLTISRGIGMRTFAVPTVVVYLLLVAIPVLGLVGAGATAYIVFHDDVVASLMARQGQMQYAYEDRLDALRGELQRQVSREASERAGVENRLHDLMSRETKLESRAALVASLADMAGLNAAQSPRQASLGGPLPQPLPDALLRMQPPRPAQMPSALGYASSPSGAPSLPDAKPRPEPEPVTPMIRIPDHLSLDSIGMPLPARLSLASVSLDKVEQGQVGAVMKLGASAREQATRLEATLDEVGLSADRFSHKPMSDQGGPFVPLAGDRDTPFGQALANVQDSLALATHLRDALAHVPLSNPLPGAPEVSSPFGARLDPFLGRPALHTGVDLRENFGTEVKATAGGRVVFAGSAGGYGNMVEVDHGNGLVTRYAHLEEILVSDGQSVETDTVVGRVGSTGRATGPHLHYEVRIDSEPVDPLRFLNVGLRLESTQTR